MGQAVYIDVIVLMEQHATLVQVFVFAEWVLLGNYVIKVSQMRKIQRLIIDLKLNRMS